ncbi:MAG: DUF58 domain-containing protein [Candidatus Accumulibacter sp.]|jgi:uncharacterized protein (DUF58 family)|nr:DUF58 domain-containing protein [Accumulibacter sp.]
MILRQISVLWQMLVRWMFSLRRDEQLPVVLTRRRIFILPTGAGLLYGVLLCTMLIGAINYNLSLGHALVFLLAGLGLVAMVHTFRNLLGLRISPGRAEPVFAGETAHFMLHVENPWPETRRAFELAFGKNPQVTLNVPPGEQASIAIPCAAPRRGRLDPGHVTLASCYPLGLFRAWSYPHPSLSCLVYPKPLAAPLPAASPGWEAAGRRGRSGQEDFSGLRERQPNDSPRHIAWKAAARDIDNHPLLVKQFDGGAAEELWLDWAATLHARDVETRLSLLAGWVLAAEREQFRYGLRLPGRSLAPDCGPAHRDACLEALALHG